MTEETKTETVDEWGKKARVFLKQFLQFCDDEPDCKGCAADMDAVIAYISALLVKRFGAGQEYARRRMNEQIPEIIKDARDAENRAWLEGRRCSECGKEKPAHATWSTCDDCL